MKKLLFLYNTHAGKGLLKNRLAAVQDALAAAGWECILPKACCPTTIR